MEISYPMAVKECLPFNNNFTLRNEKDFFIVDGARERNAPEASKKLTSFPTLRALKEIIFAQHTMLF